MKPYNPHSRMLVVVDLDGTVIDSSARLNACGIDEAKTPQERMDAFKKYNLLPHSTDEPIQHHVGAVKGFISVLRYKYQERLTVVGLSARWESSRAATREWMQTTMKDFHLDNLYLMPLAEDGYGECRSGEEITEYKMNKIKELVEEGGYDEVHVFEDSFPMILSAFAAGYGVTFMVSPDVQDRSHQFSINEDDDDA